MKTFCAGFARKDITPPLGIYINGYFKERRAEGVMDPLELCCLALGLGEKRVVLCTVDNLGVPRRILEPMLERAAQATGLPKEAFYFSATHSHTAGALDDENCDEIEIAYREQVTVALCEAAQAALADLAPCKMGTAIGKAPNSAFVRRYRMKDGSVRTNPGVNNPDVLEPVSEADERVSVIRLDREKDSLLLVSFANHPDTVGGCNLSADWPGFARRETERALPDTKVIFFNGAQGDVNHVKVFPQGGDLNGMENDFDDVYRGYDHARYLGRVVAGAVLQVYDKVAYSQVNELDYLQIEVQIPSNKPTPEELPLARKYAALHEAGKDDEIPYEGMMLTTVVASSLRKLRLENGPEFFYLPLTALRIGDVAMIGLPGEPFTGIGVALKETVGPAMVIPTCVTNAYEGYFPMLDSYEGGYESGTSNYKAGVAEIFIEEGQKLLGKLWN